MAFDCFGTNIKTVYIQDGNVKKMRHIFRNIFYSDKYREKELFRFKTIKKWV